MSEDVNASRILPDESVLLAANERALRALYEEYARQLPQHAAFWLGMAAEEERHAKWIEELGAALTTAQTPRPRFKVEAILTFSDLLREQRAYARQGTTMAAAVANAYYLEISLMERRFFEQLPQQSPEVARVLASLKKETEKHVRKTRDALTRFGNQSAADTQ
jgi:hypothetical protein